MGRVTTHRAGYHTSSDRRAGRRANRQPDWPSDRPATGDALGPIRWLGGRRRLHGVALSAAALAGLVLAGLVLAAPAPVAFAQSVNAVPLHPDYPADLLPIPAGATPRVSDLCVRVDRLYGDLSDSYTDPYLRGYDEAPVQARFNLSLVTDLDIDGLFGALRPYLDDINPDTGPMRLQGGLGDLIVDAFWMEGQSNVTVHLPPDRALEAQASLPPFPEERSDLPELDTLRAYETCHGYHDSLGGSLAFMRSYEGAQLTGEELVEGLTTRRGDAEAFEAYVFDDGGGRVAWADGDHRVSILLDSSERISEVIYLPLSALGEPPDDGLPAGAAGMELDREEDDEDAAAGATDADAEVVDDPAGADDRAAASGAAVSDGGRGLGVGMWIAGGILGVAAVAGGMALGRSRRSTGGTPPKEPATVGAVAPPTQAAPPPRTAAPTKPAPPPRTAAPTKPAAPPAKPEPPAAPSPPPAPRTSGGPVPPPPPGPRQEPPPKG